MKQCIFHLKSNIYALKSERNIPFCYYKTHQTNCAHVTGRPNRTGQIQFDDTVHQISAVRQSANCRQHTTTKQSLYWASIAEY